MLSKTIYFCRLYVKPSYEFTISNNHSVLPKGTSFAANAGTKVVVLSKGRSSIADSGTKVAVLLGINSAVASHCFPHPTLSLASEQTLKDLKISLSPQHGGEESGFG